MNDFPPALKAFFYFIGLCFILITGLVIVSINDSYSGKAHVRVQARAERFLDELKITHEAISCNSLDTDGNGYITCSYKSNNKIETIECSNSMWIDSSCRNLKVQAIENR